MMDYLNYLVEANLSLVLILLVYWLILKTETNFTFKRFYLLGGVVLSLIFPLIEISGSDSIPAIGKALPTYLLPELVIGESMGEVGLIATKKVWLLAEWIYVSGILFLFATFTLRLTNVLKWIVRSEPLSQIGSVKIRDAKTSTPSFSFFNYIIIGASEELTHREINHIVRHEMIHVKNFHSLDILFIECVRILFWFNPAIHFLKKMLSDVHEFQADDKAVKSRDVQMYCSLLARMTLKSAGLSLANHFNKSLTLKRIAMLKTVKKKMKVWKYAFIAPVIVAMFIVIACQEQVMDDLNTVVQNSSAALDVPANIQARYEELKKSNPDSHYILMELRKEGQEKLTEMDQKYGLPKSIEVFRLGEENYEGTGKASLRGESAAGIKMRYDQESDESDDQRAFAIIEYNEQVDALSQNTVQDGEIFVIVEETAQPKDGMENFYAFIINNMRYPKEAKEKGIEGRVFIEFVIEKDGSLTNLKVLKGIGHGCDDEAMRVLAMSPPWNPGRQRGMTVRQKMVMPIIFNSGEATTGSIESPVMKMIIETGPVQEVDGKMRLTGQVKDESGNPMKGAHVIAKGQTYGTLTDDNGVFQLMSDKKVPLVISFVGYKSEEIGYD
jgi:TonB family protein